MRNAAHFFLFPSLPPSLPPSSTPPIPGKIKTHRACDPRAIIRARARRAIFYSSPITFSTMKYELPARARSPRRSNARETRSFRALFPENWTLALALFKDARRAALDPPPLAFRIVRCCRQVSAAGSARLCQRKCQWKTKRARASSSDVWDLSR